MSDRSPFSVGTTSSAGEDRIHSQGVPAGGRKAVCIVTIKVDGLPDHIILVPDEEAEAERKSARNPGAIWSHSEIRSLRASGASVKEAVKFAEAKMLLKGGAIWCKPAPPKQLEF